MAKIGQRLSAIQAMNLAISEAQQGFGFVSPNPLVGCVILDKNFQLLSTGHHARCGGDHAEIVALKKVSDKDLVGAHIFVTLEPCAHEGRTPSCAQKLSRLPIASVTYGVEDPNPQVSGRGLRILQEAGIETRTIPECIELCEKLAEVFLFNQRQQLPFVALKVAASLDGQSGLSTGESQWITGEEARQHVHFLRGGYDAILVGANTVLTDNPSLNIRHPQFPNKENMVVILDREGTLVRSWNEFNIFKTHRPENIFLILPSSFDTNEIEKQVQVLKVKNESGGFDLNELLKSLYQKGITSIFVEGGPQIYSTFLRSRVVQKIYQFLAPSIIGAQNGRSWTANFSIERLEQQIRLKSVNVSQIGKDFLIEGYL